MSRKIDYTKAISVANAITNHINKFFPNARINPKDLYDLKPIKTFEPNGYEIYAYQLGDVTILACALKDGRFLVKHQAW